MKEVRILRIVVASPVDVQAERDTLSAILKELNRGIAADRALRLEVTHGKKMLMLAFIRMAHLA